MPAMLDDPTAPPIPRYSGQGPFNMPMSPLPEAIAPRQVTLRDRVTTATLIPFSAPDQVPSSLITYLCDQLNSEIEKGDTYPMTAPLPVDVFGPYWFANFGAVMLLGEVQSADHVREMALNGIDWDTYCLGSFYVKPNYPGRSSHVCNGGFIVTPAARNRGVGRLMGEGYLEWAPKLGYTYSVFNLVYETNVASCRIWDALGFKRIGRVKGCGNLKSYPDEYVDAIIYGRDLGLDEDTASEERFDKIKYYLKHGKYPNGADRAEKSRLRSAATHYKLLPATHTEPEKLMLKGKEVISDPQRQYEIARNIHIRNHGGINKSTAAIAEQFHWVRIKETVSAVIKNCGECSDASKAVAKPEPSQRRPSVDTPAKVTLGQHPPPNLGISATPFRNPVPMDFTTHFSTPQTAPMTHTDPNLLHFNTSREMPLDPRLIENMARVAGPPVAPVPQMIPVTQPQFSQPYQHHLQQAAAAIHKQQRAQVPTPTAILNQAQTLNRPQAQTESAKRGRQPRGIPEARNRSASPSAQLLAEQERTPAEPDYPPFPGGNTPLANTSSSRKRGRPLANDTPSAAEDTPSGGRETRKRGRKK